MQDNINPGAKHLVECYLVQLTFFSTFDEAFRRCVSQDLTALPPQSQACNLDLIDLLLPVVVEHMRRSATRIYNDNGMI